MVHDKRQWPILCGRKNEANETASSLPSGAFLRWIRDNEHFQQQGVGRLSQSGQFIIIENYVVPMRRCRDIYLVG